MVLAWQEAPFIIDTWIDDLHGDLIANAYDNDYTVTAAADDTGKIMMIGKDLNVSRVQVYDVHAFNKQLKSEAKMSQKSKLCFLIFMQHWSLPGFNL